MPSLPKQPFYGPLIQDNPGEPVLSQMRDLLVQPLDFYELDILPATQPITAKHYKTPYPVHSLPKLL